MNVKELRKAIREHKTDMKLRNIREVSFMNGGLSVEVRKANETLFRLKLQLEDMLNVSGKATVENVWTFLNLHLVTSTGYSEFGPQTRKAITDKFNAEHKTKLIVAEFTAFVAKGEPA